MSKLHVIEGPQRGKVFEVTGPASIGRGETCAIRLEGRHISRIHARIEVRGSDFVIVDSGSRNGIFVNGRPVKEAALRPDDQVEVGEHILVFDPTKDPMSLPRVTATVLESLDYPFPAVGPDPRLPGLVAAAASIAAAEDPREIGRLVLDAVMGAVPAERGIVLVLEVDGHLRPAARKAPVGQEEFYLSNVLHNEVFRQRHAVVAADAARRVGADRVGILCAPLASKKGSMGLVYAEVRLADGQDRPAFGTADLRFVAALCGFAGVRIAQLRRQGARPVVGEKPLADLVAAFEKDCLVEAIRQAGGDLDRAAGLLAIGRADLDGKLKVHGLAAPPSPPPVQWKSVQP